MAGMLEGKTALITGAASGIGRGTALRLAREGAAICVVDLQEDAGKAVVAEIECAGGRAVFAPADVSQPDDVQKAVRTAIDTFGGLHIVFANAGINGVWAPIDEITPDEWDRTFDINLKGTYLTLHFSIPHLREAGGGSIVICSSVNGTRTFSNMGASAYSASKAGQVAFMKMAALELARNNIRVNAICPGGTHTNIGKSTTIRGTERIGIHLHMPQGGAPFLHNGQGEPEDIADTVLYLVSDLSRHVTGVEIYVDGGGSLLR